MPYPWTPPPPPPLPFFRQRFSGDRVKGEQHYSKLSLKQMGLHLRHRLKHCLLWILAILWTVCTSVTATWQLHSRGDVLFWDPVYLELSVPVQVSQPRGSSTPRVMYFSGILFTLNCLYLYRCHSHVAAPRPGWCTSLGSRSPWTVCTCTGVTATWQLHAQGDVLLWDPVHLELSVPVQVSQPPGSSTPRVMYFSGILFTLNCLYLYRCHSHMAAPCPGW
jgi:hypothetical protein